MDDGQPYVYHLEALDRCDEARPIASASSSEFDINVDAIGGNGDAYVTGLTRDTRNPESPNHVFAVRSDGSKVANTVETIGRVVAFGADETVYILDCSKFSSRLPNLIGLGPDLIEKWRLPVPGYCGVTNVVLADDGMLYFGRPATGDGTEIVAIQTPSPGLARSAWPTWRHDKRATAWLTP